MKTFKISVVIPVYKAYDYLAKCLDSVINQSLSFEDNIELILINDGSPDNSEEICLSYQKMYSDNIIYLKQENKGVSSARNNGIKNAHGKYIMFLDSDDYLASNTIEALVTFFDEHYDEVDLVTYPLYYDVYGKIKKHKRYDVYNGITGIYDVNATPYVNQSTINVVVKNEENNQLFDTHMLLQEDQNYCTEMIMKKGKIGFVNEAIYYYRKYDASVSMSRNNPFYCFEDIMNYNEGLLKKYNHNGIPRYIQSLVSNTVKWRVNEDKIYPYHYHHQEYEKAVRRIKKILDQIDVDIIAHMPNTSLLVKTYLLSLKGIKPHLKKNNEHFIIAANKEIIDEFDSISCMIDHLIVFKSSLKLVATFTKPLFLDDMPEVYLVKMTSDGVKKDKITLREDNHSYIKNINLAPLYGFTIDIPLQGVKKLSLEVITKEGTLPVKFVIGKFASKIKNNYYFQVSILDDTIEVKKSHKLNNLFYNLKKMRSCSLRGVGYRLLTLMYNHKKDICLYYDNGTEFLYDDFLEVTNKDDNIKRYYLYDEKDKTIILSKNMLKFGSLKHKVLFLMANQLITTDYHRTFSPFGMMTKKYEDLFHYQLIYHPISINHITNLSELSRECSEIDKWVISSSFEKELLLHKYHFQLADLIISKIEVNQHNEDKNNIILDLDYRAYLIGEEINGKRLPKDDAFINSSYFKELFSFFHNPKLNTFLKQKSLTLIFKLDTRFWCYRKYFELEGLSAIKLTDKYQLTNKDIFITDFNNKQFKAAANGIPIIYFLPDEAEFKAGLHDFSRLDLPYDKAFGPLCKTGDELFDALYILSKKHFKVDPLHQKIINDTFITKDKND